MCLRWDSYDAMRTTSSPRTIRGSVSTSRAPLALIARTSRRIALERVTSCSSAVASLTDAALSGRSLGYLVVSQDCRAVCASEETAAGCGAAGVRLEAAGAGPDEAEAELRWMGRRPRWRISPSGTATAAVGAVVVALGSPPGSRVSIFSQARLLIRKAWLHPISSASKMLLAARSRASSSGLLALWAAWLSGAGSGIDAAPAGDGAVAGTSSGATHCTR